MSKLLLVFALTFTPTVFLSASAHAANVPALSTNASGSATIHQVARRYTVRRGTSSSQTPNYLLLKSDPRRYNGPNYFVHPPFLNK